MRIQLREPQGLWPSILAITYAAGGYLLGIWLITLEGTLLANLAGTLLLGHAMVIAGYLLHDAAHNAIFRDKDDNARLGKLLNWLTGGAYNDYASIRHKHFRHHADKADVVAFDYRHWLRQRPRLLKLVTALEWAYIPAVDVVMHALVITLPFTEESRHHKRRYILMVLAARTTQFTLLALVSPWALLWYAVAYALMLHVLRFMDAFQHTYEIFETLEQQRGPEAKRFDRDYEHHNTFSNLHSTRFPWLNLLTLNFAYHNAHHEKPFVPWYHLPALHCELYGDDDSMVIPFANQLRAYHRYRLKRILNDADRHPSEDSAMGRHFVGVLGVSFLTAH